jgi:hypothetical protein
MQKLRIVTLGISGEGNQRPRQIMRAGKTVPRGHAAKAGCKRSCTDPLRCVPATPAARGKIASCTGRLLAAERSLEALVPFRDNSVIRHPLRGTHKTEARVRV